MKNRPSLTITSPKQPLAPLSNAKKKQPLIDPVKEAKCLAEARRFFQQENYTQALCRYAECSEKTPEITQEIHTCQMQLLRRYLRQGKNDLFLSTKATYGWQEHLALPLARMQGQAALQALAQEESGGVGGVDATLAACALEPDLKTALMQLRKLPLYKEVAEGWICLLKGNFSLAKSTFEAAKHKLPRAAGIGAALAAMAQGHIQDAQKSIEPFRAHLIRRYPQLAQAMHWSSTGAAEDRFHTLFDASSATIEAALRQRNQPDLSDTMKGWLFLRAGDHLWSETQGCKDRPWHRILTCWKQAEDLHRPLKIDVAKRRLAVAYTGECHSLDVETEWPQVCTLLQNKPEQLNAYLTHIAHLPETNLPSIPLCVFRNTASSSKPKRFLLNPPPAFYLLYCRLAACMLRQLDHCLQLPRRLNLDNFSTFMMCLNRRSGLCPENMNTPDWNDLKTLLPLLDQTYMHEPNYLNARYSIARLMGDGEKMRTTMYHFLLCDPSQKGLLIPRFIAAFFQEVRSSRFRTLRNALRQSKKRAEFAKQLKLLHQKFPDDYDIARLMILCSYPKKKINKHIITHTSHLSGQLAHILRCQLLIDTGADQTTVLNALPEWKTCQGHPEAQERWLQLTLTPVLRTQHMWDKVIIDLKEEELHGILKRIETRGERLFFSSFLRSLVAVYGKSPYIMYHRALQILRTETSLNQINRAFHGFILCVKGLDRRHPEGCPDRDNITSTLTVFSAYANMISRKFL